MKDAVLVFDWHLEVAGNQAPCITGLKVRKKIPAQICAAPGEKWLLPINGYINDRTIKQLYVGDTPVAVDEKGMFRYDYEVSGMQRIYPVMLRCYGANESAELSFDVEVIDSVNGIGNLQWFDVDANWVANSETIRLSGSYFGLKGVICGYELYEPAGNHSGPLRRGLFSKVADESYFQEFGYEAAQLGPGYEAGFFEQQPVELIPGNQRLVIFCENPGGRRTEVLTGNAPDHNICYTIPAEQQEILFYLDAVNSEPVIPPVLIGDGIPMTNRINLGAGESGKAPYSFSREYEISGKVKTLNHVSSLIIKSFTQGMLFANGSNTITVNTDAANCFRFTVHITMDDAVSRDFNLAVIPSDPYLSGKAKALCLRVTKNFENTAFFPDFSPFIPAAWTEAERENLEVPVRFTFNRPDVPGPAYLKGFFTLNNEQAVDGWVHFYETGNYFVLRNATGEPVTLSHFKKGINRLSWSFRFYTSPPGTYQTMSCSQPGSPEEIMALAAAGKANRYDAVFSLHLEEAHLVGTQILFQPALQNIFYDNQQHPLPGLQLSKASDTVLNVYFNDNLVNGRWEAHENGSVKQTLALQQFGPAEGKNHLKVIWSEAVGAQEAAEFEFAYDTLAPQIKQEGYKIDASSAITEISVLIREAHFKEAFLYNGNTIVNQLPQIIPLESQLFRLTWSGLKIPRAGQAALKVEAFDHTGRSAALDLEGSQQPLPAATTSVEERPIDLPLYTGTPNVENEYDYINRPFTGHTKFAPSLFNVHKSVKQELDDKNNLLYSNPGFQKVKGADTDAGDQFGKRVAISGNYAIIGAPAKTISGRSWVGRAYVFERNSNGIWEEKALLRPTADTGAIHFGEDLDICGERLIVRAPRQEGGVYLYSRNAPGAWVRDNAFLNLGTGFTGDSYSNSVAIDMTGFAFCNTVFNDGGTVPMGGYYNDSFSFSLTLRGFNASYAQNIAQGGVGLGGSADTSGAGYNSIASVAMDAHYLIATVSSSISSSGDVDAVKGHYIIYCYNTTTNQYEELYTSPGKLIE